MPKYIENSPDLGAFIVWDEGPHANGAKMIEGVYEGAPGEPFCATCGSRLEPMQNAAGELEIDLDRCPTQKACTGLLRPEDRNHYRGGFPEIS